MVIYTIHEVFGVKPGPRLRPHDQRQRDRDAVHGDEGGEKQHLYLNGTVANLIVLKGPVVVRGDVLITGVVLGPGAID